MAGEITQIRVGEHTIGMIGLSDVYTAVKRLNLADEQDIREALLEHARRSNHIPGEAEALYEDALFREYRRFLGEDVAETGGPLEIRVFGPGCMRCEELMRRLMAVLVETDIPADLQHVRDLNKIAELGPLSTPILMINGKVVSAGKVPTPKELKALLQS
jgi:small redox-active disulfide protein 2